MVDRVNERRTVIVVALTAGTMIVEIIADMFYNPVIRNPERP